MKHSLISVLLLIPFFAASQVSLDREVIASGGSSYSSENLQVDQTIGELSVSTNSSGNIMLAQGFHQYYEEPTAIPEQQLIDGFNIYPNPVSDQLTISYNSSSESGWNIQVVNVMGNLMPGSTRKMTGQENTQVTIDCQNYPQGVYFVRLISSKSERDVNYKFMKIE